jgi:hypothetical protein
VRKGEELEGKLVIIRGWLVQCREKRDFWKLAYVDGDYLIGSVFEWLSMGLVCTLGRKSN